MSSLLSLLYRGLIYFCQHHFFLVFQSFFLPSRLFFTFLLKLVPSIAVLCRAFGFVSSAALLRSMFLMLHYHLMSESRHGEVVVVLPLTLTFNLLAAYFPIVPMSADWSRVVLCFYSILCHRVLFSSMGCLSFQLMFLLCKVLLCKMQDFTTQITQLFTDSAEATGVLLCHPLHILRFIHAPGGF